MRISVCTLVIIFILQCTISIAQNTGKELLQFRSFYLSLGANQHGKIIVASWDGEVAITDSVNGYWRKSFVNRNAACSEQNTADLDKVCFFNADTAFIAGNISNGKGSFNFIYHSADGGKSWKQIDFGMSGSVNDIAYLNNGEAWLGVTGNRIAYTKDYGFTWTQLPAPGKKKLKWFDRIFFNAAHEGMIGSPFNELAYTANNGKSWTILPTPLDQKKYNKTDIRHHPRIMSVAILNNYLLVNQEGLVFYSKKDKIDWVYIPGYRGFVTDAENSALFFYRTEGGYVKADSHLQPVATFESINGMNVCRNGSLYIFSRNKMGKINTNNQLSIEPMRINVPLEKTEPTELNETDDGFWGFIEKKIYLKRAQHESWNYICTLPFSVDSGSLFRKDSNTIVYSRNDDSVFYYSIIEDKVERRTNKEMLQSFCSKGIKSILFSKGLRGCFGEQGSDTMVYNLKEDRFVLSHRIYPGGELKDLPDNANEIDKRLVDEFVKKIPSLYRKQVTIDDLEFTQQHYDTCRQNILTFQKILQEQIKNQEKEERKTAFAFYFNNVNFSRLLRLVDSVNNIDPTFLAGYLRLYEFSSYNSWSRVIFVNADNELLEISSRWYTAPQYFYFPWTITLNGLSTTNRAIEINHFLKAVFPKYLDDTNKIQLIQNLVKELYEKYGSLPRE